MRRMPQLSVKDCPTSSTSASRADTPHRERLAKFWVGTARAWQQHGRPDQACRALLAAERQAPEEIRRTPFRTLSAPV
jgi:hypothetical protein